MFSAPRQLYYTAEAEVLSNDNPTEALSSALLAVDAYKGAGPDEWAYADEAGARSVLALAHAKAGDAEAAEHALRPVLNIGAGSRINGIVRSLLRVDAALADAKFSLSGVTSSLREEIQLYRPISNKMPNARVG
jgi:hypothetical protein